MRLLLAKSSGTIIELSANSELQAEKDALDAIAWYGKRVLRMLIDHHEAFKNKKVVSVRIYEDPYDINPMMMHRESYGPAVVWVLSS